jgi:hypothetical protein
MGYANFKFGNFGLSPDIDQYGNWTLTNSTATTSTSDNLDRQRRSVDVDYGINNKKVKKPAMYKLKKFNDKLKNIC